MDLSERLSLIQQRRWGPREERFLSYVRKTTTHWWWEGATDGRYGRVFHNRRAHQVSYEMFVGPLKKGHHIHHRCGEILCVRPAHLVQMTKRQHEEVHR